LLSYQHSFHAGNHADVLKHITVCATLSKLVAKPKPFFYLDTHAGSACYVIDDNPKNDKVVAKSVNCDEDSPEAVKHYYTIIQPFLSKFSYPGSPLVADGLLDLLIDANENIAQVVSNSNLQLNELHPSAAASLSKWMRPTDFNCHMRDAFEFLNASMPPKPNRGMVLIDPPYEQAKEYRQVSEAVANAVKKWPSGVFCIWYPLLSPERIDRRSGEVEASPKHELSEDMLLQFTDIAKAAKVGLLDIRFAYQSPSSEVGMYGSGMVIFSPPWQLEKSMQEVLLYLTQHLQLDTNKLSSLNWLAPAP